MTSTRNKHFFYVLYKLRKSLIRFVELVKKLFISRVGHIHILDVIHTHTHTFSHAQTR